jgi:hypothetical protein
MIMNNNVAPNNVLVGDTWIILLIKIVKESTQLLTRINYSITYTTTERLIATFYKCPRRRAHFLTASVNAWINRGGPYKLPALENRAIFGGGPLIRPASVNKAKFI